MAPIEVENLDPGTVEGQIWGFSLFSLLILLMISLCLCFRSRLYLMRGVQWVFNISMGRDGARHSEYGGGNFERRNEWSGDIPTARPASEIPFGALKTPSVQETRAPVQMNHVL